MKLYSETLFQSLKQFLMYTCTVRPMKGFLHFVSHYYYFTLGSISSRGISKIIITIIINIITVITIAITILITFYYN